MKKYNLKLVFFILIIEISLNFSEAKKTLKTNNGNNFHEETILHLGFEKAFLTSYTH